MHSWLESYTKHYTRPYLLYDLFCIKSLACFLKNLADQSGIKLFFAVKSFPHKDVLCALKQYVHGFEISNFNEYTLLREALPSVYSFVINDPTMNFDLLTLIVQRRNVSCYYNLDFLNEEVIEQCRNQVNSLTMFGVRISHTSLAIQPSGFDTGVKQSRFGVSFDSAFEALKQNKFLTGISIHNGPGTNSLEYYFALAKKICSYMERYNIELDYVNFGGCLHFLTNREIKDLFTNIRAALPKVRNVIFEPGGLYSRQAGYAFCRVLAIKKVSNKAFNVITDISNECNLKWSQPKYIDARQNRKNYYSNSEYVDVTFCGATCFEYDIITKCKLEISYFTETILPGTYITFSNINGYAFGWNKGFNGISQADILFTTLEQKS